MASSDSDKTSITVKKTSETNETAKYDRILSSHLPEVLISDLGVTSFVEFVLAKIQKNVDQGRRKWLTNVVTEEELRLDQADPFSRSVASALVKRGMGKGDVGIYMTSDVTRIYAVILGIWRAGGIVHPTYPEDSAELFQEKLEDSKAAWIFCNSSSAIKCQQAAGHVSWPVEIFVFGEPATGTTHVDTLFMDDGHDCPPYVPNPGLDEPILILCSGGTTGRSKATVHTNRSVIYNLLAFKRLPWRASPMLYLLKSAYMSGVFFPFHNACEGLWTLLTPQINSKRTLETIHQFKPFFVFGLPRDLLPLVGPEAANYDYNSVEVISAAGCYISEDFCEKMRSLPNLKSVIVAYGSTEAGFTATTDDLNEVAEFWPYKALPPGTVGRLRPNTSIKIVNSDSGLSLGPNGTGELLVQSPRTTSGYLNRPAETAALFSNGYIKTGDVAYYDENGFLFVLGRVSETISYCNHQIYTAELEQEILKHPAVSEVTVFGILDPRGRGQIPRALVELNPTLTATGIEIQNFVNGLLPSHKQLSGGLFIVEEIPRTSSGKISKGAAANLVVCDEAENIGN